MGNNQSLQEEELMVLSSVFSEEEFFQNAPNYTLLITSNNEPLLPPLKFKFSYPSGYPSSAEDYPIFVISSEILGNDAVQAISQELIQMYTVDPQIIVFRWVDWLKENYHNYSFPLPPSSPSPSPSIESPNKKTEKLVEYIIVDGSEKTQKEVLPHIYHGLPITDRKSKFQAHLAEVHNEEEVKLVVDKLLQDKKIASAAHNIQVFRIQDETTNEINEYRNDDGEAGAADKVLFVMEKMGCVNILVVVTRWYGGINLGNDRFKHITNQAKELIEQTKPVIDSLRSEKGISLKLRPADEVYSRIQWDSQMKKEEFVRGYLDRFEGLMEIPLEEFDIANIPFHRVQYYKRNDVIVWDRLTRLDKLFSHS